MMILFLTWKKNWTGEKILSQLLPSWNWIWITLLIALVVVLINVALLTWLLTKYWRENSAWQKEMDRVNVSIAKLTVNSSFQSKSLNNLTQVNDKITTMLGTKDPLAFQAVQGMNNLPGYANIDYVDPSDEAEVGRLSDLTRSSNNATEQDDELPAESHQSEWNDWDDPEFVAKSIAEGTT